MHSEKCPVCKGQGAIPMLHSTACRAVCHGCQGKGWIEVSDDRESPRLPFFKLLDAFAEYISSITEDLEEGKD